jgi:hypothetical protein
VREVRTRRAESAALDEAGRLEAAQSFEYGDRRMGAALRLEFVDRRLDEAGRLDEDRRMGAALRLEFVDPRLAFAAVRLEYRTATGVPLVERAPPQ